MLQPSKDSVFKGFDLNPKANNAEHKTVEISTRDLIVRRGQAFVVTVTLKQPLTSDLHQFTFTANTGGEHASRDRGTLCVFALPGGAAPPPSKQGWTVETNSDSSSVVDEGALRLNITPPAACPVGLYELYVKNKEEEENLMGTLTVLFNPWCPDDSVYLDGDAEREEYVMRERGIIYKGSGNYIVQLRWDFGQFEKNMEKLCIRMLDLSTQHKEDPAQDVSARGDPAYISRVVSAMINSQDDRGVLTGNWTGAYWGGKSPAHWTGSHPILNKWFQSDCRPVRYGQCWVFAGVMCSVLRLLGIPCRVVTNFQSAHDTNKNLIIDVYHSDYGVREKRTRDSVWNYHVWVEAWMKRPDLAEDGSYDGWQAVDPTPQEKSDGILRCGPASVKAIRSGNVDLVYDTPFVFAEVNADCIDWMVKKDGSEVKIWSDTKRVGQNISTKSVGLNKRHNITDTYKPKEGTEKERSVFKYALSRDYSEAENGEGEEAGEEAEEEAEAETEAEAEAEAEAESAVINVATDGENAVGNGPSVVTSFGASNGTDVSNDGTVTPEEPAPNTHQLTIRFEEVTTPRNGHDVELKMVIHNEKDTSRPVSINISVQAMTYDGSASHIIQNENLKKTMGSDPGKDLIIPISVPFSAYMKPMLESDSMKVSAVVMDTESPFGTFLAENDVILLDPPISVSVSGEVRVNQQAMGEIVFMNPVQQKLQKCSLSLSGSGLWTEEVEYDITDLLPNRRLLIKFPFTPHKAGEKELMADFDCSLFRDIKCSCTVNVLPETHDNAE